MIDEKTTPEQIRQRGMEALKQELGIVGMVRFLQQFDNGQADYAVDRHAWQDQLTVEDVLTQIHANQEKEAG